MLRGVAALWLSLQQLRLQTHELASQTAQDKQALDIRMAQRALQLMKMLPDLVSSAATASLTVGKMRPSPSAATTPSICISPSGLPSAQIAPLERAHQVCARGVARRIDLGDCREVA